MPVQYYAILGVCIAIMALSAWYLGDENRQTRGLARVGIVLGGTGIFISTMYYGALLIAVLIVVVPIALFCAWWSGLFS